MEPAAFGRLCVETLQSAENLSKGLPAAFGRLCVETMSNHICRQAAVPAAFGRLCVETVAAPNFPPTNPTSRLRAAVC